MLEKSLEKIADTILSWTRRPSPPLEKYKKRMERFEPSREWERAVIVFFIINAVRRRIRSSTTNHEEERREARGAESTEGRPHPETGEMNRETAEKKGRGTPPVIDHHNRLYYQLDAPKSRFEYDALLRELTDIEERFPNW